MRIHEDRPGGAGGYPDDRNIGNARAGAGATPPGRPAAPATSKVAQTAKVSHGAPTPGGSSYGFYDDDGYSDPAPLSEQSGTDDYYDDEPKHRKPFGWNAGADLGLLILRWSLGGLFLVHGAQKLFGVLGGPGSEGFAQMLQKMGYQQSPVLALVTGGTELGAGALLVLGLFTPLAAAGVLGVMANVVMLKLNKGFFVQQGGFEYEAMLGAMALGLMFTGPGRVALDFGRAWFRRPVLSGFISLLIAAGASAAVLILLHHA